MKYLSILIILLLFSCSEEDETLKGCSTGIRDGKRQLIRCATKEQHLAGNNVAAGGVGYFANYKNPQWEKCDQCK